MALGVFNSDVQQKHVILQLRSEVESGSVLLSKHGTGEIRARAISLRTVPHVYKVNSILAIFQAALNNQILDYHCQTGQNAPELLEQL